MRTVQNVKRGRVLQILVIATCEEMANKPTSLFGLVVDQAAANLSVSGVYVRYHLTWTRSNSAYTVHVLIFISSVTFREPAVLSIITGPREPHSVCLIAVKFPVLESCNANISSGAEYRVGTTVTGN